MNRKITCLARGRKCELFPWAMRASNPIRATLPKPQAVRRSNSRRVTVVPEGDIMDFMVELLECTFAPVPSVGNECAGRLEDLRKLFRKDFLSYSR